jgi:hypothetical protein
VLWRFVLLEASECIAKSAFDNIFSVACQRRQASALHMLGLRTASAVFVLVIGVIFSLYGSEEVDARSNVLLFWVQRGIIDCA